jgi:hypothetical protein
MSDPWNGEDPFASGESTPAVSWKDVPVGTVKELEVTGPVEIVQERVFGSTELRYWTEKDGSQGKPRNAAVIPVIEDGEPKALWLTMKLQGFKAVQEAMRIDGQVVPLASGDKLLYKLTERKDVGKGNPQNIVAAKINRATRAPVKDAFAADEEPPF